MTATATPPTPAARRPGRRRLLIGGALTLLVLAMVLDTRVVTVGSDGDLRKQAFDPDRFGAAEFPRIRDTVIGRAPEAASLAAELAADKTAAVKAHGTLAGGLPVMPVSLSGVVGEGKAGIFDIAVEGMPADTRIRVQTGPAINGTELRDVTGDILFGGFTNQIEFQDAGAGINRAMAAEVLAGLDRATLTGKTVAVTGVFTLINPKNWLVTPVALKVTE